MQLWTSGPLGALQPPQAHHSRYFVLSFWLKGSYVLTSLLALKTVVKTITHNGKYSLADNAIAQHYPMLVMLKADMEKFWPALHNAVFTDEFRNAQAALLGGAHRRIVFCNDKAWVDTFKVCRVSALSEFPTWSMHALRHVFQFHLT